MKTYYVHGQCKASGLETDKIYYNIFGLRHVRKVAARF